MLARPPFALALGIACATGLAAGHILLAADVATPSRVGQPPGVLRPNSLPPGETVVARIDGVELHLSDVEAAQQNLPPQAQKLPLDQIYPVLLDRLVDGALLTEAGRK